MSCTATCSTILIEPFHPDPVGGEIRWSNAGRKAQGKQLSATGAGVGHQPIGWASAWLAASKLPRGRAGDALATRRLVPWPMPQRTEDEARGGGGDGERKPPEAHCPRSKREPERKAAKGQRGNPNGGKHDGRSYLDQ